MSDFKYPRYKDFVFRGEDNVILAGSEKVKNFASMRGCRHWTQTHLDRDGGLVMVVIVEIPGSAYERFIGEIKAIINH